jgi:hypothetical protein
MVNHWRKRLSRRQDKRKHALVRGTRKPGTGLECLEKRWLMASAAAVAPAAFDDQTHRTADAITVAVAEVAAATTETSPEAAVEAAITPKDALFSRLRSSRELGLLPAYLTEVAPTGMEPPVVGGDYNGDRIVSGADLVLLIRHWGAPGSGPLEGWVGMPPDERVDQNELDAILLNWLRIVTPPPAEQAEGELDDTSHTSSHEIAHPAPLLEDRMGPAEAVEVRKSETDAPPVEEGSQAARDALFTSIAPRGKGRSSQ